MTDTKPEHRIAKLLARAGVASRREIERMIAEGRVALDGQVLDTPATVLPSLRGVTVDGNPVEAAAAARLFLYHKPPGLLVTERDPAGRATIYDRLPKDLPRVVPVGRLDLGTEGLLLLTTDGGLKRTLELPATGVERAYRARAYGEITQGRLEELIEGVEIEGIRYGSINANLERRTGANVWIELVLTEGKNREVRRVLEHIGLQVSRLIRTRYGPFVLGDLPAGAVGEVAQHQLVAFIKDLGRGKAQEPGARANIGISGDAPAGARPGTRPAQVSGAPGPIAPDPMVRLPRPERAVAAARPARARPERIRPTAVTERGDASNPWTRPQPGERPTRPAAARPAQGRRDDRGRSEQDRGEPLMTKVKHFRAAKPPRDAVSGNAPRAPGPTTRGDAPRAVTPLTKRAARSARGRPDDGTPRPPRRDSPAGPARPAKGPAGGRGHPPRGPKGGKR